MDSHDAVFGLCAELKARARLTPFSVCAAGDLRAVWYRFVVPVAGLPPNERERLAALASYNILDTPPEPDFDAITQLVAQICETPFAVINLVAERRQFFKSEVGLGVRETPPSRRRSVPMPSSNPGFSSSRI